MDACLIEPGFFINNKLYMVSGSFLEFLLIFFNSKLFNKIILPSANNTGGKGIDFMNKVYCVMPNQKQIQESIALINASDYEKDNFINTVFELSELQKQYLYSI